MCLQIKLLVIDLICDSMYQVWIQINPLGPSKSIHRSGDFVIARFVSTYFTVILPGVQMLFVTTGSSL